MIKFLNLLNQHQHLQFIYFWGGCWNLIFNPGLGDVAARTRCLFMAGSVEDNFVALVALPMFRAYASASYLHCTVPWWVSYRRQTPTFDAESGTGSSLLTLAAVVEGGKNRLRYLLLHCTFMVKNTSSSTALGSLWVPTSPYSNYYVRYGYR